MFSVLFGSVCFFADSILKHQYRFDEKFQDTRIRHLYNNTKIEK